ncbi:MAG: hypothetical protein HGA78_01495 [Nitrospirales bacterium]|nr:hypothetical protein [Nitrospirales bacterium]
MTILPFREDSKKQCMIPFPLVMTIVGIFFSVALTGSLSFATPATSAPKQESVNAEMPADQEQRIIERIIERRKDDLNTVLNNQALEYLRNKSFKEQLSREVCDYLSGKTNIVIALFIGGILIVFKKRRDIVDKVFQKLQEKVEKSQEEFKAKLTKKLEDDVNAKAEEQMNYQRKQWDTRQKRDALYKEIERLINRHPRTLYVGASPDHKKIMEDILGELNCKEESCAQDSLPKSFYEYLLEGDAYFYIDKNKEAIEAYKKAKEKSNIDYAAVWRKQGNVHTANKEYFDAYKCYDHVTKSAAVDEE